MLPHCAAAGGSTQTMRHNGSSSPSWILAVSDKFSFVGCCRMVSRKEGEDELPVSTLFLVRVVSLADVVILPFLQKMEKEDFSPFSCQ